MATKTCAVESALCCESVTDLTELTDAERAQDLIVEPLAIKAPRSVPEELEQGGDSEKLREIEWGRVESLKAYPGRKILLCSEMQIFCWTGEMRSTILEAVNYKVYASCRYQQSLLETIGVPSEVIYEPINEYLYYPGPKKPKQVVAIGATKYAKNTQMVIEVFKRLKDTAYETVYVGCPAMWSAKVTNKPEIAHDTELYHELLEVCDTHHKSAPGTFVARTLSESAVYMNFAFHEVCCRTGMEALMAGCGIIGGQHPIWQEYPSLDTIKEPNEVLPILENFTIDATWINEKRQWAVENFSYTTFSEKIKDAFNEY
jgi:glycosyltransferase involved in cell wall biosynthesis